MGMLGGMGKLYVLLLVTDDYKLTLKTWRLGPKPLIHPKQQCRYG